MKQHGIYCNMFKQTPICPYRWTFYPFKTTQDHPQARNLNGTVFHQKFIKIHVVALWWGCNRLLPQCSFPRMLGRQFPKQSVCCLILWYRSGVSTGRIFLQAFFLVYRRHRSTYVLLNHPHLLGSYPPTCRPHFFRVCPVFFPSDCPASTCSLTILAGARSLGCSTFGTCTFLCCFVWLSHSTI